MSFYIYIIVGFLGGIIGGMGMGGGTLLIPLLTIICGVEQRLAQGVNLIAFLPMAITALALHAKNGLIEKKNILWLILPAILTSIGGSLLATLLPNVWLRRSFGIFLIGLAVQQFFATVKSKDEKSNEKEPKTM